MKKQTWEFHFICVTEGESKEEAFQAALQYLSEQAAKGELEYSGAEFLSEEDEE